MERERSAHPRVALIHATPLSIPPVKQAFARLWPDVETSNLLEDSLSVDRAKDKEITPAIVSRIQKLADYAMLLNPCGILFTCSAFGPPIEQAARRLPVPVLKPNEAMFEEALAAGNRIALVTTFPASIVTMAAEFEAAARAVGSSAILSPYFVAGAMDALGRGDAALHNSLIADTVSGISDEDAIMLGQFSMCNAIEACRALTSTLILTAPDAAVRKMKKLVQTA